MNLLLLSMLMIGWQPPAQGPNKPASSALNQSAQHLYDKWNVEFYTPVGDANPPKSLEQAINQALGNHPDMRLAEAELRVAEAKLAQVRMSVSQKVTEEFHRLEKERSDVEIAKANWERFTELLKRSAISQEEVKLAQHQLASAKARLAATENSWALMMGRQLVMGGGQAEPMNRNLNYLFYSGQLQNNASALSQNYLLGTRANEDLTRAIRINSDAGAANTIDQLKTHLDSKVKLEKQTNLDLEQAFKITTEGAGLKLRVKLPIFENKALYKSTTRLELDSNEYPLHTWLQLIVDEMNSFQTMSAPQRQETPKRFDLYVREYGLLLTSRDLAPPDAMTVQELWKQALLEKAAKEAKKPQENVTPKK
jgi:hypothetical protein